MIDHCSLELSSTRTACPVPASDSARPRARRGRPARVARIVARIVALWALVLCGAPGALHAAGLMTPVGGQAPLTLDAQHVDITIENGYAVTRVEQTFRNSHATDLDAHYRFPIPEGAAVGEFTYWIDGSPVHAEVLERKEARELHESEKARGAETALVEKDDHRAFDILVSPVRAGADVRVRLVYLQRAAIDHSIGRYVYPLEDGGTDAVRDEFWTRDESVASAFSFRVRLRSAYPVDAVRVPGGQARITQLDAGEWEVVIDSAEGRGATVGQGLTDTDLERAATIGEGTVPQAESATGVTAPGAAGAGVATLDRDLVVYWRLADDLPGAVDLVTYREPGAASGTFMLTMTPGADLAPIDEGRDWVFVLDTSGSMEGKFTSLVEGVRQALGALDPNDRYRVILFSDRATELTAGFVAADAAQVQATLQALDGLSAGGGTNLFDGLTRAVRKLDDDRTTSVVLVTDGVANVGITEMSRFLKIVEPLDLRLFTAVMGNGANRPLLDALTAHSQGFAVSVSNDDDITGLLKQATSKVTHEVLHDIALSIDGVRTGELTLDAHTRVFRGEQLVVLGKYTGTGEARVTLSADISGSRTEYVSPLVFPAESTANPELERLWAYATIETLQARERLIGADDDTRSAIVDLAVGHGLVTDRTSMIVVRDEVFAANGIERRNASRIERERLARETRANGAIESTRQDAAAPAFQGVRQTTSNGGGSLGLLFLLVLGGLASFRGARVFGERRPT